MRIKKRISVVFLLAVFAVVLFSAAQVSALKPLRWEMKSSVNLPPWSEENPTWVGDIWRGDGVHGAFYWYNMEAVIIGPEGIPKEQKFNGIWWADFDDGESIQGTHVGSFTFAINQYTINGRVSEATGDWSYLIGRKIHCVGLVDWTGGLYGIGYSESIFQIN